MTLQATRTGGDMGKIGRTYTRPDYLAEENSEAAFRRFDRTATEAEDRKLRRELMAAVISVIAILAFIGWALSA
jgi:hypothetical protein